MNYKHFWAVILALVCVLTVCVPAVYADETVPAETVEMILENVGNYNIVGILDGSGSLEVETGWKTDEHGYRYDAFSMFLNLLTERGNEVGAIVFSGNQENDISEEAMRSGLKVMNIRSLESQADKDQLLQEVKAVPLGNCTDAGTALLQAAEMLEGMTEKNGKPSIILLFTDGVTEVPYSTVREQAKINRDLAVKKIYEEGIRLCGVFLNNNKVIKEGTEESVEVLNIVRDANGFPANADPETQMGGMYIEVNSADDLMTAYQRFYALLTPTKVVKFNKEKEFIIPGIGVSDVNINIIANRKTDDNGRPLSSDEILEMNKWIINNTNLTIVGPDGEWSAVETAQIMTRGNTFLLYKIPEPEKGTWKVTVNTPDEATDVECGLIINVNISAQMELEPAQDEIPAYQPLRINASLFDRSERVTDAASYWGYDCTLTLSRMKEDGSEELKFVDLKMDENGTFSTDQLPNIDLGKYSAVAEFKCGEEISITTDKLHWKVTNEKPVAESTQEIVLTTGLFSKGKGDVDLSGLVTDDGPIEYLEIDPFHGTYNEDALDFSEEPVLKIDGTIGGDGTVRVVFADPFGESAETELVITMKNRLIWDILLIVFILLAVAATVVAFKFISNGRRNLDGTLGFELSIPVEHNMTAKVRLDVRGVECKNKSLARIFEDRKNELIDNASYEYMIGDDSRRIISAYLKQHDKALSEIKVKVGPVKGKKEKAYYMCQITAPKGRLSRSETFRNLSDGSMISIELDEEKNSLDLEYRRGENDPFFDDDEAGLNFDDTAEPVYDDDFETDFED